MGLALGLAVPVPAQDGGTRVIRGIVQDSAARAVQGVRVAVVGLAREVESDARGQFELRGLPAARIRLVTRRLGFAPETLAVSTEGPEPLSVTLTLGRPVNQLPTVRVLAAEFADPRMQGFYERARLGRGRFLTAADIERRGYTRMTDVLRMVPGMTTLPRPNSRTGARMRAGRQAPLVWLDGTPLGSSEFDLDSFDPRVYSGVEIYSGPATVPAEFAGNPLMSSSGGVIVLWTKRGQTTPRRVRQPRSSSARLVRDLVARAEAFGPGDVDEPARQAEAGAALQPEYPDSLLIHGIGGSVLVEFIVDSLGAVRLDTFGVIATSHPLLVDPVRSAVAAHQYVPAKRAGRPVAQVVMLPFVFVADSSVVMSRPRSPR